MKVALAKQFIGIAKGEHAEPEEAASVHTRTAAAGPKEAPGSEAAVAEPPKERKGLKQLVRKHKKTILGVKFRGLRFFLEKHMDYLLLFFGKNKAHVDLSSVLKIVNFQNKLELIFTNERPNLGMKYRDMGKSLWTNEYLESVQNILKNEKVEFELGYGQTQLALQDVDGLFTS